MPLEITARARLHLGFLDLTGGPGRRYGGIGLSLASPRLRLILEPHDRLSVEGEAPGRVERLAALFYSRTGLSPGARIRVVESIPEHVGLGSGTQTALGLASGLARLPGLESTPQRLAAIMGRGRRSGIGLHTVLGGGFVVDGGHPPATERAADDDERCGERCPPLLARHEVPESWRILVMIPDAARTVSGPAEERAFLGLSPQAGDDCGRMARLVLMRLLPALVEADLDAFGSALAAAQEIVGACFSRVQDGPFHPGASGLARSLKEGGVRGVGQSSWGPAIYAFAADDREVERLMALSRAAAPRASLLSTRGFNRGASIESVPEILPEQDSPAERARPLPGDRRRGPRPSDRLSPRD